MKKIISLILILASILPLCACGALKKKVQVEITKDNFFDYFEYVEFPELYVEYNTQKDSAGNVKSINFLSGYYLKDKYSIPLRKQQDCKVEAGVTYTMLLFEGNKGITVDLENHSYSVTGKQSRAERIDEMITGTTYQLTKPLRNKYCISFSYTTSLGNGKTINDTRYNTCILTDIELVSASGTMYLYE